MLCMWLQVLERSLFLVCLKRLFFGLSYAERNEEVVFIKVRQNELGEHVSLVEMRWKE